MDTPSIVADAGGAAAPLDPELRRDPSQYRGRENPTDAAEVASWVPRALFLPVYVVTEYGIRVPLYKAAEWVDRKHIVPIVEKIFNPVPHFYWSPTIDLNLGAVTFFGVQARYEDLGIKGNEVKASIAFGGLEAWRLKGQDRWQISEHTFVGARGFFETRWDRPYYGIGPYAPNLRANFRLTRGDVLGFAGVEAGNHFRLQLSGGYRQEHTSGSGEHDLQDPSIEQVYDTSKIPGYGEDIHLGLAMLDLRLDSRFDPDQNGGVRFVANATYAHDTVVRDRSFITAEGSFEVAAEISHPDRVLAARFYAADSQPLGDAPIPFTHLITLGQDNHHGFLWGRFRDESALLAELRYRYPIAYFVDAQWTVSAGNVFARHFQNFDIDACTASIGAGLRTRRTGQAPLELTFAVGTSRFDERFEIESFRVYFTTTEGL